MPFGLLARVDSSNHVLDGVQITLCEGATFRGKGMLGHDRRHSAVSPAKTAEPVDMPFPDAAGMGPENHVLEWSSDPPMQRGNFEGKAYCKV